MRVKIDELKEKLSTNPLLTEAAFDLIMLEVDQSIKNINNVFATNFPKEAIELLQTLKIDFGNKIPRVLEPLYKLAEKYPSAQIALDSGKRLNYIATGNIALVAQTFSLDRITSMKLAEGEPGFEKTREIFADLKELACLSIDRNLHLIQLKKSGQSFVQKYQNEAKDSGLKR